MKTLIHDWRITLLLNLAVLASAATALQAVDFPQGQHLAATVGEGLDGFDGALAGAAWGDGVEFEWGAY